MVRSLWLVLVLASAGVAWSGEIILLPQKADGVGSATSAGGQRARAKGYRKEQPEAGSEVVLVPEDLVEEDGMLSPRGGVESSATENRLRAKVLRQSDEGHQAPPVILPGIAGDGDVAQERARNNRLKARAYREHGQSAMDSVGSDGIPLVLCTNTESVAGRIGDDVQSGSLIYIISDGKSVKARCR